MEPVKNIAEEFVAACIQNKPEQIGKLLSKNVTIQYHRLLIPQGNSSFIEISGRENVVDNLKKEYFTYKKNFSNYKLTKVSYCTNQKNNSKITLKTTIHVTLDNHIKWQGKSIHFLVVKKEDGQWKIRQIDSRDIEGKKIN